MSSKKFATINGNALAAINNKRVNSINGTDIQAITVPIEDFSVDGLEGTIVKGTSKGLTSRTELIPSYCTLFGFDLTTSNASVVSVNNTNLTITAEEVGSADVTVTSKYNPNVSHTYHITVSNSTITYTITLDTNNLQLDLNGTVIGLVEATVSPNATVEWAIDDPGVATITTNGNEVTVTAVDVGTTTLTASCGGQSATCSVTVVDSTPQPYIESVSVSPTTKTLYLNGSPATATLTATVDNRNGAQDTVGWSSSPDNICTIAANGKSATITAVATGSTTITVTSTVDNTKSATCSVTVTNPTVSSVSVSPSSKTLDLNGTTTVSLSATVSGTGGPSQSVTWSSSDTSIATVNSSSGYVTAKAIGTCTIYATSSADNNKKGSCYITVTDSSGSDPGGGGGGETCLLHDTEVLLANGTTKKIQNVDYNDLVMTYNPYLDSFIAEYPTIITESTDGCTSLVKRITLENGEHLDICWAHECLIKQDDIYLFKSLSAAVPDNELIGLDIVCYDKDTNSISTSKIVSCELLLGELFAKAYNVFVPLHGTIITNSVISGGDMFLTKNVRPIVDMFYINQNRMVCNKTNVDTLVNAIIESDDEEGYIRAKSLFGNDMSKHVYFTTIFQYVKAAERLGLSLFDFPEKELIGTRESFSRILSCIKPVPATHKVKIDENIYTVDEGELFTFPEGHTKYLDLSSCRVYLPGEQKKFYCSVVIIPIDED